MSPLLTIGESVPREMPHLANWVGRLQKLG